MRRKVCEHLLARPNTFAFRSSCVVPPLLALFLLAGCGSNSSIVNPPPPPQSALTVTLSDPTVCGTAVGGPFQHIYVTISDVQAYASATTPLANGVDLTPNLSKNPMQIDLLAAPGTGCILATLGSSSSVPPGTYQAVQVALATTSQAAQISGNKCLNTNLGPAASCAVLADGSVSDLDPGFGPAVPVSIIGAQITFSAGSQMLNLDFDACASMVQFGGGGGAITYGMDPVLHAALMPAAGAITGRLLDSSTQQPVAGDVIVALEQADANGVDRQVMQVAPGSDGSFVLCPVPPGTYDIVATALSSTQIPYVATVLTGVQAGEMLGNIPLHAVSEATQTAATITGEVTVTGPGTTGGYAHVMMSALQSVTVNGNNLLVTIPILDQYASTLRIGATVFANYQLEVPPANSFVGAFVSNGDTTYQQNSSAAVTYEVEAESVQTGTQPPCNPAIGRASVTVSPGSVSSAPTIALMGCPPA